MGGRTYTELGIMATPGKERSSQVMKGGQSGTFTLCGCINCFTEEFISCITYIIKH